MQTDVRRSAPENGAPRASCVPAPAMWFAVLGGPAAWSVHLLIAWSVMEVSCYAPAASGILNRGGTPGPSAWTTVLLGIALPWITALASLLTGLWIRRRRGRLLDSGRGDSLALERLGFLTVLGFFLSSMALAAITGGAIAVAVLRPCG